MATPLSLLGRARGFARDYPRDQMPPTYLWDSLDLVPTIMDATLTGRGGWEWGSDNNLNFDVGSGILAVFLAGDQLLVQSGDRIKQVRPDPPYDTIADRGATFISLQNPVQLIDTVIHLPQDGSRIPQLWRSGSIVDATSAMKMPKVATVFKSMLVSGGSAGEEHVVRFSVPGQDLTTAGSYDDKSNYLTSQKITGLAALRSMVLIFHPSSTERMRGSTPASSVAGQPGDMFVESLFDHIGCQEPKTILNWNESVVFADEHGVHLTDGAVVKNLVNQGGIQTYWRPLWQARQTACACVFLDYYIITVRTAAGPVTLVCDLNHQQWFRFSNIDAVTYIASAGSSGMERVWAGIAGTSRLARIGPCFFPTNPGARADGNGSAVYPAFETPWYSLGGEGRKRIRFAYLSYDVRLPPASNFSDLAATFDRSEPFDFAAPRVGAVDAVSVAYIRSPQDTVYNPLGNVPSTMTRSRYRLPLGQFPYGVALQVRLITSASVYRVFDLALEAQAAERSRV